jgi:hypothetical protein
MPEMGKCVPPNIKELLERYLEDGAQWYEIRSGFLLYAYDIEDYDKALLNAKHIAKIFPGITSFIYVWKESGRIQEERLF